MSLHHPDFTSTDNPETLIVYGLVGDPRRILAELAKTEGNIRPLTNRYALVSKSTVDIRLFSSGWMNISLNERLALDSSDDLFLLCAERLLQNTHPFSGPARQFLKIYLEFVKAEVAANRETLVPVRPESEIFTFQDFAFAAWLPLTDARILLPPNYPDDGPAFAEVNIAFRQQGRVVAVLIDGTGTPVKSTRQKLDFLQENHPHLDVIHVQKEQLRSGTFPVEAFPDSFGRFWEGIDLPIGPCPPVIELIN